MGKSKLPRYDHVDVLIIGAGISGIGAAYHLQAHAPHQTYSIIEARESLGGTWDLFRYPGIRSDSDMYTFGYKFKPWVYDEAISPGHYILDYLHEASAENDIDRHIIFSSKVTRADWSSKKAQWTIGINDTQTGEKRTMTCRFVFSCGGYFNYEKGYSPKFADQESFSGDVIHPQHWPQDYDYIDKKIVVVGSGATAVTLVPALAERARHVTMLQRSPTYIVTRPAKDPLATFVQRWLPTRTGYFIVRWRNILGGMFTYSLSKRFPNIVKRAILKKIKEQLSSDFDVKTHFTPSYNPWDQRICLVPDGDLFKAIDQGKATVVTDRISRFTTDGLLLESGTQLEADTVVTATGLNAEVFSGIRFEVDGNVVDPSRTYCYKGMMLSGMPNLAFSVGYTNASWTLKSDLIGEYVCRLINHMEDNAFDYCVPKVPPEGLDEEPLLDFTSGYVLRVSDKIPKQGSRAPWKLHQNYILDRIHLGHGSVEDDAIQFVRIERTEA
ncbi:MAG: flavin-containing monooxygenase [Gammaproteobacteria bacterium]